ncbi:MAG: pseudouridine synthase [Bacteroidota bacterium]
MARPSRPKRDSKNTKNERTTWKKPDGTPLRKRKGDYFPDQEIEKRSTPRRRFDSEDASERPARDADRRNSEETRGFGKREQKPYDGKGGDKHWGRKDDRGKPWGNKSEDKRPWGRKDGGEKPWERKNEGDTSWERKDEGPKPRGRKNEEAKAWGLKNEGETTGREGKRFDKKQPSERTARSSQERKTYSEYRRNDRDTERKPWDGERTENRTSDRKTFSKDRGEKPAWKKRERYDRIEHSENMGNRFDRPKGPSKNKSFDKKERAPQKKSFTADVQGAVRLNRYISNAGICSRREADDLISAGVISVNGEVVTELGTKVMPSDEVRFHDRVLRGEKMVYVLLNKPKDYITTTDDPDDRKTVMNLVHDACKERIFPVGRLDRNTTGLLLLTNDGDLTKKLTHPSNNIAKVYQVELDRNLTLADMQRASEGVELEDGEVAFDNIEYASPTDKKIVGVELHSGKNRIVRRMFEELGYEVKKLDRTVFAGLTKKDLPRGRWRFLTELEVNGLKMMKGGSGRGRR